MIARILIADDHLLFCDALRMLVERDGRYAVVGAAHTAAKTIAMTRDLRPDLVLLDISMPGGSGLGAIAEVSTISKVLVLSMHNDAIYARQALQTGACGYALKESPIEELLKAIDAILEGDVYVHPSLMQALLPVRRGRNRRITASLSRREEQILRMICLGHTGQQTAAQLGLSVRTVETYRVRLRGKLGVRTRADLVAYALEQGLL